ncbi:nucleotidyltransferase family protein [Pseudozobellia sp. WGM2]|uniref:nucleotidyltransferase family protein n=1 Tax=Pseudozobellia sp. WGM2 TaxID=2787625 RepID=UPI001AE042BE|nr:nucleotidyltransferase family protein [Pseudozobellia sp. WGM2]
MKSLNEIRSTLQKNKSRLFLSYPIKSMAIFGSFARNEAEEASDLDILVEFSDRVGVGFIDLANELETIVELKVDLVSRKGIKERYLRSIEEDLIYV